MNNIKEALFNEGYYATPMYNNLPFMSILVCCRMSRGIGGPTDILTFLSSFIQHWRPQSQEKIEILIKFDLDDKLAIKEFVYGKTLQERFPTLNIRPFFYGRWEGRGSLYLNYANLFSHRNPSSKYIAFGTDDSFFYVDPIEEIIIPYFNKYTGATHQNYSLFTSRSNTICALNSITDWTKETYKWANGDLTEPYPIVSANILEICGGMGWQSNIDNWLSLLNVILYVKYGINLLIEAKPYIRRLTDERPGLEPIPVSSFNKELFVDDTTPPQLAYYYKLVERQADNIYYNINYGK